METIEKKPSLGFTRSIAEQRALNNEETIVKKPLLDLTPYLKLMVQKNASDLFLTVNSRINIKFEGQVVAVGRTVLTADMTREAAYNIMSDKQIREFKDSMESDFAFELQDNSGRFRVNVFRQRGDVGMVLRLIPSKIPTMEELSLPPVLTELISKKRGLVLMVGASGSGKSTTLAAMLDYRNRSSAGHILTIEDPVEFSHPNRRSIVNQREVGVDTHSYQDALKASLREAPDVILIGEIRNRETMEAVMELCNTGHLVVSTLHSNNANQALERVINMFPQNLHKQLFMDLSLNLVSIISQRLVMGLRNRRCAAIEILVKTPHIAELILKGEIHEIKESMEGSGAKGMVTFDSALYDLYQGGQISEEEALNNADSKANLEAKINFGG